MKRFTRSTRFTFSGFSNSSNFGLYQARACSCGKLIGGAGGGGKDEILSCSVLAKSDMLHTLNRRIGQRWRATRAPVQPCDG
jgi:hypothetical protein